MTLKEWNLMEGLIISITDGGGKGYTNYAI